ncbi:MAG: iron-containing alcohol dehydrogenase, partial [Alphaproteobacteria bacterium]|nr:iron-containing alcohol dehydrogenase [Alphaproteobacteria bacterium]
MMDVSKGFVFPGITPRVIFGRETLAHTGDEVRNLGAGLPVLRDAPQDTGARTQVLFGAWLCSTALGHTSMAMQHKLAHVIGGTFNTPHAETHAILLPHTAGFNAQAVPDLLAPVAEIFGGSVGGGIWDFAMANGAPLALR